MKKMAFFLTVVFLFLAYELLFGQRGWQDMWALEKSVAEQKEIDEAIEARNLALDLEVKDLQEGTEAVEEVARQELGYVQDGEVFYRIVN